MLSKTIEALFNQKQKKYLVTPKSEKTDWVTPNLVKKLYDKVDKHSRKENGLSASRLIEKWMQDYINKYDL